MEAVAGGAGNADRGGGTRPRQPGGGRFPHQTTQRKPHYTFSFQSNECPLSLSLLSLPVE
eukprot:653482-Pyramimonas_sp.AAC.1